MAVILIATVVFLMTQSADGYLNQCGHIFTNWNAPQVQPYPSAHPSVATSTALAQIPTIQSDFNDFLLEFNEPKMSYNYVMTAAEAEALLAEKYPGELVIAPNKRVSDRKAANKMYHASQLGTPFSMLPDQ